MLMDNYKNREAQQNVCVYGYDFGGAHLAESGLYDTALRPYHQAKR